MITEAEIIDGVIKVINEGWCQHFASMAEDGKEWDGRSTNPIVAHCLIGGFRKATGDLREQYDSSLSFALNRASAQAKNAMREKLFARTGSRLISKWNDMPGRTKEEVIALLQEIKKGFQK